MTPMTEIVYWTNQLVELTKQHDDIKIKLETNLASINIDDLYVIREQMRQRDVYVNFLRNSVAEQNNKSFVARLFKR